MNKQSMEDEIIRVLIGKGKEPDTFSSFLREKIQEKTKQQLQYILSPINQNIFLEACAGSGKTEVIGIKAAYEINKWKNKTSGIAILTFTNEATDTIKKRVNQYLKRSSLYPHHIGTLTGFIHGYIAQKFGSKYIEKDKFEADHSYLVIDKEISVFNNAWLKKYELSIPIVTSNKKKIELHAHQVYFDKKVDDFIINFKNHPMSLKEYYKSTIFQDYVQDLRKKKNQLDLLRYNYLKKLLKENKITFYKDGFANFEDMNFLAYSVLIKSSYLVDKLAKRFPVIIVDECQDLSWIELEILKILKNAGVTLHFVGDLNQAIYEFKGADPDSTLQLVSTFKKLKLTKNFRSTDQIVRVANQVASISQETVECATSISNQGDVFYFEYNNFQRLKELYIKFLSMRNVPIEKSIILVRQQSLKNELEGNYRKSHPIIEALQLWYTGVASKQILALELAGKALQKYFGVTKNKASYYCPISIDSIYRWKIFLKDFLNAFNQYPELLNFNDKTYKEWYKLFRKNDTKIINVAYEKLKPYDAENRDFSQVRIIAPRGTAEEKIDLISEINEKNYPKVSTIHAVKGNEFDAVMVVSSQKDSSNGTAHWKKWIGKNGEARRIGYVANTRAKHLLIWAVPILNHEERSLIESYGFKPVEL